MYENKKLSDSINHFCDKNRVSMIMHRLKDVYTDIYSFNDFNVDLFASKIEKYGGFNIYKYSNVYVAKNRIYDLGVIPFISFEIGEKFVQNIQLMLNRVGTGVRLGRSDADPDIKKIVLKFSPQIPMGGKSKFQISELSSEDKRILFKICTSFCLDFPVGMPTTFIFSFFDAFRKKIPCFFVTEKKLPRLEFYPGGKLVNSYFTISENEEGFFANNKYIENKMKYEKFSDIKQRIEDMSKENLKSVFKDYDFCIFGEKYASPYAIMRALGILFDTDVKRDEKGELFLSERRKPLPHNLFDVNKYIYDCVPGNLKDLFLNRSKEDIDSSIKSLQRNCFLEIVRLGNRISEKDNKIPYDSLPGELKSTIILFQIVNLLDALSGLLVIELPGYITLFNDLFIEISKYESNGELMIAIEYFLTTPSGPNMLAAIGDLRVPRR